MAATWRPPTELMQFELKKEEEKTLLCTVEQCVVRLAGARQRLNSILQMSRYKAMGDIVGNNLKQINIYVNVGKRYRLKSVR